MLHAHEADGQQKGNTLCRKVYEESYHEEQCELGRHCNTVEMLESSEAQGQPYPQLQTVLKPAWDM